MNFYFLGLLSLQYALAAPESKIKKEIKEDIPESIPSRDFLMSAGIRFRRLGLPDKFVDKWFYDEDEPGANPFKRPSISAHVVGIEYTFKPRPMNWIIYVEYMGSELNDGYWDDVDQGTTKDHEDGDWVRADNFSGWFFGGNYAHEFAITPPKKDIWLNLLIGGGLGMGFIQGDLAYWHPGSNAIADRECYPNAPAYIRKNTCEPDGVKAVPRVLPMVDISMGLELNFADRATIRIDGGLHNLLYYGTAIGGIF